ncbi:MAG TPA: hypothetical protein VLY63_09720 [Anaerolineae bacterium]|nr:hypothetical protein [Anaerolineae bacterium]
MSLELLQHPHNTGFSGVTHFLLLELDVGLVLVDTGHGIHDSTAFSPFLRAFMTAKGVPCDPEATEIGQLAGLGILHAEG